MLKVGIRVDGGETVGLGHIMRCMSLAFEFSQRNIAVYFIVKNEESVQVVKKLGYKYHLINGKDLDEEAFEILDIIKNNPVNLLIVDSYSVSIEYFNSLKKKSKCMTLYIDDKNEELYPVDFLVNGNIGINEDDYKNYNKSTRLLLGCKYNLVRKEYIEGNDRTINNDVKRILITTGGTDPYNSCLNFLKYLKKHGKLRNIHYDIVYGFSFKHGNSLVNYAKKQKNITIHKNLYSLKELMLNVDIAISAGGSTIYELAACGTPTIGFIMADNQERNINVMSNDEVIISMGWYNKISFSNFTNKVQELVEDFELRKSLSAKMRELVDGKGSKRVVDEICNAMLKDSQKHLAKV